MTILIDSDILIEVTRGRDQDIVARWLALSQSETTILYSPVTAAELWGGALPREHEALTRLFNALQCVAAEHSTGQKAGEYLKRYGKSHGVELGDALIAASAVHNHAALWTRNHKQYPMKDIEFF